MNFLLAIDIGTTSLKAALIDEDLRSIASARREYPTSYPAPDHAEQNPSHWYTAFCQCCTQLLEKSGTDPMRIAAIGIDGMSSLALPLDGTGRPLAPAMIWLDRRAKREADQMASLEELIPITGNRSDPSNFAPKVMWIRRNLPEVYERTSLFLHCNSYLAFRLTGSFSMDRSQAGMSQLCEISSGEYSSTLLQETGIDTRKLPPIYDCTDMVGKLTTAAARECGLVPGTPVVAGAMDNVAATVGLGLWQEGDAYISAGTATNVGRLTTTVPRDGRGLVYHFGSNDRWLVNGGVDYGAAGLHWFRNLLGDEDFSRLSDLAAPRRHGEPPLLFLPFMTGQRAPIWNEDTTGCLLGLTPQTEQRHLVRALMEGTGLGARLAFSLLSGSLPERVMITGGIASAPVWLHTLADCLGIPLRSGGEGDATALGTAIIAGVGVGLFPSFPAAFSRMKRPEEFHPNQEMTDYFNELYQLFTTTHDSLTNCYHGLAQLRTQFGGVQ